MAITVTTVLNDNNRSMKDTYKSFALYISQYMEYLTKLHHNEVNQKKSSKGIKPVALHEITIDPLEDLPLWP